MTSHFNVVFAFKEAFSEESAEIISYLRSHPSIWAFIRKESNYLRIANYLLSESKDWNTKTIIDALNSTSSSDESIAKNPPIQELINEVQTLRKTRQTKKWNSIIPAALNDQVLVGENLEKWGTIFSYFIYDGNERINIISALLTQGEKGQKIVSYLIKVQAIQINNSFFGQYRELFEHYPSRIRRIFGFLSGFGDHRDARMFVRTYLDHIDNIRQNSEFDKQNWGKNSGEDIQELVELSLLAHLISDDKRMGIYQKAAQNMVQDISNPELRDDDLDTSLLERSRALNESDKKSAQELCLKWLRNLNSDETDKSLIGIRSEKIESLLPIFFDVDLYIPAMLLLERILKLQGKNDALEIMLGERCADLGDHDRAIHYLYPLFGENLLSRELTIKLANAYAFVGDWKAASFVINSVNDVSVRDVIFRILCELRSDPDAMTVDLEKQYPTVFRGSLCYEILKLTKSGETIHSKKVRKVPNNVRDVLIAILYHEYSKGSEAELLSFLAEIRESSPFASILYIQHFSNSLPGHEIGMFFDQFLGEVQIEDQGIFEMLIAELQKQNLKAEAKKLIKKYKIKWPLSKKIKLADVESLINSGKYQNAEKSLGEVIAYYPIDNEIVTLFGVHLLRSTRQTLPYSRVAKKLNEQDLKRFSEIIASVGKDDLTLENQILKIEILSNDKTHEYLSLGSQSEQEKPSEKSQILFSIGTHFYEKGKFDQAIFYLKESRELSNANPASFSMLVDSYSQLKLFEDATHLVREAFMAGKISESHYLLSISKALYASEAFIAFLNESRVDSFSYNKRLALAQVKILRGSEIQAVEILDQILQDISQADSKLLDVSDLFHQVKDDESAKRVLNTFLSNKQDLEEVELIKAAKAFYQLGLFERALNILSMVDEQKFDIDLARANILQLVGEDDLASEALQQSLLQAGRKKLSSINGLHDLPYAWDHIDPLMLEKTLIKVLSDSIDDLGFQDLISRIEYALKMDQTLVKPICNAIQLTGTFELLQSNPPVSGDDFSPTNGYTLLGMIADAINKSFEVDAARLIAAADEKFLGIPLYELMKARLQYKQDSNPAAKEVIQNGFDQIIKNNQEKVKDNKTYSDQLVLQINLCEALCDIGNPIGAYGLIKLIYQEIGFTPRVMGCYSQSMSQILVGKAIDKKLLIKHHQFKFDNDDKAMYRKYLIKKYDNGDSLEFDPKTVDPDLLTDNDNWKSLFENDGRDHRKENLFIGTIDQISDNPEEAISVLKSLLKTDGNNPRLLFALGLAYNETENYLSSYTPISLALEIWPEEYHWHKLAAELCEKLGDHLNASLHQKQFEELTGGNSQGQQDKFPYIQEIIDNGIYGEQPIPNRDLPILMDYADKLLDWGNNEIASRIIDHILRINPDNKQIQILKARVSIQKSDAGTAELIQQVIENYPESSDYAALLISNMIEQGHTAEAEKLINQASDQNDMPESRSMEMRAALIEQNNGLEAAIDYIEEQLSEHSTLDILETGVQFMISHKGYQYAQKYADILLQKGASSANALYLSGILAQENGDLDRALSYFNRAKIIDPRLTQIYIESANIHEIKRQFDFALKTIEEGIRYNQDAFLFLKYAGKYLINKGKKKSAQDCLQRAYTINKYDDELEEILYILDNKNNTFGNRLNESKN